MNSTCFEELVQLIGSEVQRLPTRPDILSVREILSCTIRYLATCESMTDISYTFRIAQPTISKLIFQCCNAIWNILHARVLLKPQKCDWVKIANEFNLKWNFPNCVGSMDGKHIVHQAFTNSGSTNYNYKETHSIILLATCDADYCFTLVDIGAPGRCSNGGVFRNSTWGKKIVDKTIEFPDPAHIDRESGRMPFCETQYCLAILVDKYENAYLIPGQWRNGHTANAFAPIHQMGSNHYSAEAKSIRENLKIILVV